MRTRTRAKNVFVMKFAMVKADPVEVTKVVRQQWADLVSVAGARETTRDAPVMRALANAFHRLSQGRGTDIASAVTEEIHNSDEWTSAHKDTITSMFLSMVGRPPSSQETTALWSTYDTDELADQISDMQPNSDSRARDEDSPMDPEDDAVDDSWMANFEQCYGRDASVYEYIKLRPTSLDMTTCAQRHKECFAAMREVYRQYFDQVLEEREFVKRYVPVALTSGPSLVEDERDRALCTDAYRDAMLSRLSELYAMMSGDNLLDKEVAYLFEERVKGKQLPLDTEELNTIVAEYVNIGESLRAEIQKVFRAYMSRDAHTDEVDAWLPRFRMESGALKSLKSDLACSHEFHSVVTDIISSSNPHLSRREKFRILGEVLKVRAEDLRKLSSVDEIHALISPLCAT